MGQVQLSKTKTASVAGVAGHQAVKAMIPCAPHSLCVRGIPMHFAQASCIAQRTSKQSTKLPTEVSMSSHLHCRQCLQGFGVEHNCTALQSCTSKLATPQSPFVTTCLWAPTGAVHSPSCPPQTSPGLPS